MVYYSIRHSIVVQKCKPKTHSFCGLPKPEFWVWQNVPVFPPPRFLKTLVSIPIMDILSFFQGMVQFAGQGKADLQWIAIENLGLVCIKEMPLILSQNLTFVDLHTSSLFTTQIRCIPLSFIILQQWVICLKNDLLISFLWCLVHKLTFPTQN